MRIGIAVWNHKGMGFLEHVEYFARAGFRAVSALGAQFVQIDEETGDRLAELLRRHGLAFTIHHKLPGDEKPPTPEEFPSHVDIFLRWQLRHGLLTGLTFDVGADPDVWLSHLRRTLEAFRDEEAFVCCEDFPLNDDAGARLGGLDREFPRLGILVDLGHMNLRITKADPAQDMPRAVERYLRAIPLPIRELHVHNNDGARDQHQHLGAGTLPVAAAGATLRELAFDGISTIEFVPGWNDIPSPEGYELARASARTWDDALRGA
jgi:sugar phosphate isomerase/epimerase